MVSVFHESHKFGRTSGQEDKEFLAGCSMGQPAWAGTRGSLIRQTEHSEGINEPHTLEPWGRQLVTPMKNSPLSHRRLTSGSQLDGHLKCAWCCQDLGRMLGHFWKLKKDVTKSETKTWIFRQNFNKLGYLVFSSQPWEIPLGRTQKSSRDKNVKKKKKGRKLQPERIADKRQTLNPKSRWKCSISRASWDQSQKRRRALFFSSPRESSCTPLQPDTEGRWAGLVGATRRA